MPLQALALMKTVTFLSLFFSAAIAHSATVQCLNQGHELPFDNSEVEHWRTSSPDQFKARAHIQGRLSKVLPEATDHQHFEIQIGPSDTDLIEVIYNKQFGSLPKLNIGSLVEACGDYITARSPSQFGPASPAGAIIHWVHASVSATHPNGFLIINGVVYGLRTAQFQQREGIGND